MWEGGVGERRRRAELLGVPQGARCYPPGMDHVAARLVTASSPPSVEDLERVRQLLRGCLDAEGHADAVIGEVRAVPGGGLRIELRVP